MKPFALYIHIPFCLSKCKYCDFYSVCVRNFPKKEYFKSLIKDFLFQSQKLIWKDRRIFSIYFGGGTPSLIEPFFYNDFINIVKENFKLEDNIEITLEANPRTLTKEKLLGYKELGINRISLGVQSFNNEILKFLGRAHGVNDTFESIGLIKDAGFKNISLDLIYGIPSQTLNDIKHDLEIIKNLDVSHISYYSLIIEEKTAFYKLREEGKIKEVGDTLFVKMDNEISNTLKDFGFTRYEISNYSKFGFESKHNLAYWESKDFLGLGASAYSGYLKYNNNNFPTGNVRYANVRSYKDYINIINSNEIEKLYSYYEENDLKTTMFEYIMMGLRKKNGVSFKEFEKIFNKNFLALYSDVVLKLEKENLINVTKDRVRINEDKVLLSNSIIEEFL